MFDVCDLKDLKMFIPVELLFPVLQASFLCYKSPLEFPVIFFVILHLCSKYIYHEVYMLESRHSLSLPFRESAPADIRHVITQCHQVRYIPTVTINSVFS